MSSKLEDTLATRERLQSLRSIGKSFAGIIGLVIFLLTDFGNLSQQEKCFKEAKSVVQELLEICRDLKLHQVSPRDNTEVPKLFERLETDCEIVQASSLLKREKQGKESLLLAAGRIQAGVDRWIVTKETIDFFRKIVTYLSGAAFLLAFFSLFLNLKIKEDALAEFAERAWESVNNIAKVLASTPFKVLLALVVIIILVHFAELRITAEVLKNDLEHKYLLEKLIEIPEGDKSE